MTLKEWVDQTKLAIEQAGFTVEIYQGFPLIKVERRDRLKLLDLKLPLGGHKRIYAEGVLVVPA